MKYVVLKKYSIHLSFEEIRFPPFVRNNDTEKCYDSLGLGLSAVKAFVELLEGAI